MKRLKAARREAATPEAPAQGFAARGVAECYLRLVRQSITWRRVTADP